MSASALPTVQPLFGYERGVFAAFDYVSGAADYDKTVCRLSRMGSRALTILGEVHLQEAASDLENSETCLTRANDTLNERVYSDELGFDPRAAIRLAQMPLHKSILLDNKMPEDDVLAESYHSVLWAATTAANHFTYRDDQTSLEGRELLGTISEAAVLLLAARFALQNSLTQDWTPVQSLLAEDFRAEDRSRGWDMSIYIPNKADEPTICHKVQIKNSLRHLKKYSRDIAIVAVNPDLTVGQGSGMGSVGIISDLQKEASPFLQSSRATKRLERRTEKLLTVIDRAK